MQIILNLSSPKEKWLKEYFPEVYPYFLPILGKPLIEYYMEYCALCKPDTVLVLLDGPHEALTQLLEDGGKWGIKLEIDDSAYTVSLEKIRKKHPNFFSEPSLIWIEGFFFPLYSNPEFSKEEPLWSIQRNQQIKTISSADGSTVLAQKSLPSCQEIGLHSLLSYYSLNMNLLSQWTEHLFMKGYGQEKHVFIGMNVSIRPGTTLNPPFIIGDNTHIENTAQIESGSIIGDSCIIDQETQIRDSIVFGRTYISPSLFLKKKIITFYRLIDPFSGVKIDFSTKIFASQIHNNPLQRYFYKTIAGIVAFLILIPLGPLYLFFKKIGIKPQSYITYQTTDGIDSLYKLPIYTKQFSTKGKWFFRFSLDKVPLLCQALQGKLSLVGDTIWNRETHLDLINRYKDYSPGVFNYSESVRPPDFVEKITGDLYYKQNRTIFSDISLISRFFMHRFFS